MSTAVCHRRTPPRPRRLPWLAIAVLAVLVLLPLLVAGPATAAGPATQVLETAAASAEVEAGTAAPPGPADGEPTDLVAFPTDPPLVSRAAMLVGLAAATVALPLLVLGWLGLLGPPPRTSVATRISGYTRQASPGRDAPAPGPHGVTALLVGMAEKALRTRKGLAPTLALRLEAAGVARQPAEWLLAHTGVAVLAGAAGLLAGSGSLALLLAGLALGWAGPAVYLRVRTSRRTERFKAQLADTLQLMAGSLSAGLSLAQSLDTVVREGADPISGEFRRALVESRLGVEIEDALEGISVRMDSRDFGWVVMALRIQREVGGNLPELLRNVAATIREREYLERQVRALSAEGRLSMWILGVLPPAFLGYLLLTNPGYLEPLVSSVLGFGLLALMAFLLGVGVLWMQRLVKVEV